jgi:hypothetical protein
VALVSFVGGELVGAVGFLAAVGGRGVLVGRIGKLLAAGGPRNGTVPSINV